MAASLDEIGTGLGNFLGSTFNPLIGGTTKVENKVSEKPDSRGSTTMFIGIAVVVLILVAAVGFFSQGSKAA